MELSTIVEAGQEIVVVDFSNCKEQQMIDLLSDFRKKVISGGKPVLALAIFNEHSYFTARFMRSFESDNRQEVIPFIRKQALVGISDTKRSIIMGYNQFYNRDIRIFDAKAEALAFLVSE